MRLDDVHCFVFGTYDFGLSPATRASAILVLHQQVGGANLALWYPGDSAGARTRTMMGTHVGLELLSVGALRGFPAGHLLDRVEVVREVFRVGVADFPVRRKTSISHDEGKLKKLGGMGEVDVVVTTAVDGEEKSARVGRENEGDIYGQV